MKDVYNVVAKGFPRHESEDKVRGKAFYTDDLEMPGMVYGAILRSPYPRAKVVAMDASAARKLPGVVGILLPEDVPQKPYNCSGNPPSPLAIEDERILTDHPLHVGDRVAAVAATSHELCQEALSLISVQYEPLPPVFDLDRAISDDAPVLHPEISSNNIFSKIEADQGDIENGFDRSDLVIEDVFETPGIFHVCMETVACICDFTRRRRIWSSGAILRPRFQETTNPLSKTPRTCPRAKSVSSSPRWEGGFGSRQQLHNQVVGALLSRTRESDPLKS